MYHFVSYLPVGGRLYELDGLRAGPIDHGPLPIRVDWIDVVRPIIRARINKYVNQIATLNYRTSGILTRIVASD